MLEILSDNEKYYIHRIRILTSAFIGLLKNFIKDKELAKYCQDIFPSEHNKGGHFDPFNSSLNIILPTNELIDILIKNCQAGLQHYKIVEVEVTCDVRGGELEMSLEIATMNRKWGTRAKIVSGKDTPKNKRLFRYGETFYLGGGDFNFKMYLSRNVHDLSDNDTKWIHKEFTFKGAPSILKHLRIVGLGGLKKRISPKNIFKRAYGKYIENVTIDMLKLGAFVTGKKGRKKYTKREIARLIFAARSFMETEKICNYMDLKIWIKGKKMDLKNKHKLTDEDRIILGMRAYRFRGKVG